MSKKLQSMKKEMSTVLADAKAMAFIQVVRRHVDANLGDVFDLAKEYKVEGLNIQDVFLGDLPANGRDWAKKTRALKEATKTKALGSAVETRTAKGRRNYAKSIMKSLSKKGWKSAIDVRDNVGGTPDQARRALNRLIQSGDVEYRGKARATEYRRAS